MQKLKILIIIILIMNLSIPVYADDEIEEAEITKEELQQIVETAAEITDEPLINSKYAIIYDRSSRQYFVWKK